ncbi:MAG: indolepyruvate ferredoxin oxidoreductase family protein [Paracoccaceae bacterium]|nr:indolepyruvate ferredoxin oxidoreductase family protein [Paracoccaceae bacterium]
MSEPSITLADKFDLSRDRVFLSGTQALVRLCLLQADRDRKAGLNTAGYVSGYRGSPLGGLDLQFQRAAQELSASGIVFEPGLNEDLAATAIWGTQQAELHGEGTHDGVFGAWYGKGPGVDRSGDVFRHANLAGTSPRGGVLVLTGDDHTCESSTTAHQSEFALVDAMIPILNPANVADLLEYGLHGWSLSRFAGTWCGLKCVKDTIESSAVVDSAPWRYGVRLPETDARPAGGLNIRLGDTPLAQEARLHQHKLDAVRAYVRANRLNRVTNAPVGVAADEPDSRGDDAFSLGIVSTGKSWMDTLQALETLGLNPAAAAQLGICLYKVAMPWPLEPEGLIEFATGLDLMIVVEEKRGLMEPQAQSILYGRPGAPRIIGKRDEQGEILFQAEAALNPLQIATVIGTRAAAITGQAGLLERSRSLTALLKAERESLAVERKPYFCAGCPHNTSTRLPEGARAYAGIGCHWMAQFMDRDTEGYTHMGGEGANWIGESRFSRREHIFQNLGDGTYNHSGQLAIRAAMAVGANMTFKILFNDAVAMTGGQGHEGGLTARQIAREVAALGVARVDLVSDDPSRHAPSLLARAGVGPGAGDCRIHHRDRLLEVQRELAATPGVTVLIYEQTCAAEKRRRRKRGTLTDPPRRIFINERVCEGCGDCGRQSNCVAIMPVETAFGRKRRIDQYTCNKDYSCVNGFCPSFVTVENPELSSPGRPGQPGRNDLYADGAIPDPILPALDRPWAIAITGVGGTGVVTLAALLGMAAHIDGCASGMIDMAGLAQKGGAVVSHIKIARTPDDIRAIRIAQGGADLLLGCDLLVTASRGILTLIHQGRTSIVLNRHELMTGDFVRDPDFVLPTDQIREQIREAAGRQKVTEVDATRIAAEFIGDTISANLFLLGTAYQLGQVPLSSQAIRKAIRLNGVSTEQNLQAFAAGRHWVLSPDRFPVSGSKDPGIEQIGSPVANDDPANRVEAFAEELIRYQDAAYADRYRRLVSVATAIDDRVTGSSARERSSGNNRRLSRAVARSGFKLMAYKDEYEVARLYTDGAFQASLRRQFRSHTGIRLHLAPPLLARRDPLTGRPRKRVFGSWVLRLLSVLRECRRLRGTWFDPFGHTGERRTERQLIVEYETLIRRMAALGSSLNYETAVELAELPEMIRGFGPVKLESIENARSVQADLLDRLEIPSGAAANNRAGGGTEIGQTASVGTRDTATADSVSA